MPALKASYIQLKSPFVLLFCFNAAALLFIVTAYYYLVWYCNTQPPGVGCGYLFYWFAPIFIVAMWVVNWFLFREKFRQTLTVKTMLVALIVLLLPTLFVYDFLLGAALGFGRIRIAWLILILIITVFLIERLIARNN